MKQRVKDLAATAWDRIRYGQDESAPAGDSPRWPLYLVVWGGLPLAIIGAGVLSATATLQLAADHGVGPDVQPFLVFMVEVVSLSATLLAIFSTQRSLRIRAMVLVVGATLVAMVAGWYRYQGLGLLAGIFMVYLVHLVSATWLELRDRKRENATMDTDILVVQTNPLPDQSATELLPIASPSALAPKLPVVRGVSRETVAAVAKLCDAEPKVGRPRLRTEFGVTDHQAKQLLEKLRKLQAVDGAA